MGTCPNCGHKAIFFSAMKCKLCGKEMCNKCAIYLFKLWSSDRIILDKWYVCSQQCLRDFESQVEKQVSLEDVGISEAQALGKIPFLVKRTLLGSETQERLSKEVFKPKSWTQFQVNFAPIEEYSEAPEGNLFWERLEKHVRLMVAQNLIKVRNFEGAAKIYEKFGMLEEAGKVRGRDREIRIRKTEVVVDLNKLLQQVRDGGIVAAYRCPHCSGKLKISKDTTAESLKVCPYCGSEIEVMELADFLRTALS